jgi:predicted phage baseplate assembly protein
MPLDDHLPVLDDHTYDSIVTEMKSRIARYTPEWQPVWTDFNDSDPGITMVQVFAWLGEMLAFRMNQVPELVYLKFLQLLGIELRPAEPAYAQITFPVRATSTTPTVTVPLGTQVIAETPGGGPPLVFEADHALVCVRNPVAALLAYDGYAYADVTAADQALTSYRPFGPTANAGSALAIGFDATAPLPGGELTFYVWAAEPTVGTPVTCGLPASGVFASATLSWQYWDGFGWSPLILLKDDTAAFTRSGPIVVKVPDNALATVSIPPVSKSLYWLRVSVDRSQYERPPVILAIRPNTMTLTQMETVKDEVLGGSDGRRDQTFRLAQAPVLSGTLELTVDQGEGPEVWTPVDDFSGSGPGDSHYVLNRTTGEVRFGDGVHGAIPIANMRNPGANVVAATYRYGGGTSGNVAAGKLNALRNAVDGIDDRGVVNVMASYGGQDEETLDEAKERAPASVRSRCRAVTTDDFELFATEAADIARAKAFPLRHPDFPGVGIPGVVTVVVVPRSRSPQPVPSDGTLRTVCAYLDERRLLTTEVYVAPPTYQLVSITAEITADDSADLAEVQRLVDADLLAYLHPLTGGEDGTGWPFGGTVAYSRVAHRILSVPGAGSIARLVITLDGVDQPECRDVPLAEGALASSLRHQVTVAYPLSGGAA